MILPGLIDRRTENGSTRAKWVGTIDCIGGGKPTAHLCEVYGPSLKKMRAVKHAIATLLKLVRVNGLVFDYSQFMDYAANCCRAAGCLDAAHELEWLAVVMSKALDATTEKRSLNAAARSETETARLTDRPVNRSARRKVR